MLNTVLRWSLGSVFLVALPVVTVPSQAQVSVTARSSVGQVGQRQTRTLAAPNAEPLSRVSNRLTNRVQSRLRNRLGPFYDPQANAVSPFRIAGEQAQRTTKPIRR
jgi:hypothetical protein